MEISKIRIHGNFHLGEVLLTGKDLAISDYSGDPSLSYSERRLRRSVFVDLVSMIASFYEVAFDGFLHSRQVHAEDAQRLLPMATFWAHYISGFFVRAYKERAGEAAVGGEMAMAGEMAAGGVGLIPASSADFEVLLQYFMVQKAMTIFNVYLKKDPRRLIIPQMMLRAVLPRQEEPTTAPEPIATADTATTLKQGVETSAVLPAEAIVAPKPADVQAEKAEKISADMQTGKAEKA